MRAALSAVIIATLAACSGGTTMPRSSEAQLRVGASQLHLAVSTSSPQLDPGARDTLRVLLTNDGPSAVVLHFRSGCHVLPYVRDSAGSVVLPSGGGWMCTAAFSTLSLGGGQVLSQEYVWDGSDSFASEMPVRRLDRGTYYFSAELNAEEGSTRAGPLAITVR